MAFNVDLAAQYMLKPSLNWKRGIGTQPRRRPILASTEQAFAVSAPVTEEKPMVLWLPTMHGQTRNWSS